MNLLIDSLRMPLSAAAYLGWGASLGLCCWAGLFLVAASGGYSSMHRAGFSAWLLLLWSTGSRAQAQ